MISSGTSDRPAPDPVEPARPLAAFTAAPVQSLVRSAGSIWSRRMLSTLVELTPAAADGTRNAYERSLVAMARIASESVRSLTVRVFVAHPIAPCGANEST